MKRVSILLAAAVFAVLSPAYALAGQGGELANIKVVTDANPDYSDMESMVHSITSNWPSDAEKMYALFYWDHIARRQTAPMILHGIELTDPIRQFNDYGYTMCSTISGIKNSEWQYMGYPSRLFDIGLHTVPDVWYDGKFHHYDNSLSAMYTLPDGKTIASVEDIGRTLAGPETNGEPVPGYIALYHCLNGTSPDGYLEGADTERTLRHLGEGSFKPSILKYRSYYYGQERGHRYILNLRDNEVYTRFYSRQDIASPNAVVQSDKNPQYKADPAYFVPNGGKDPETANPRYHIRGNGERTWTPILDQEHLAQETYSTDNIRADAGNPYLVPIDNTKPAEVVFKVEGANVITSLKIHAEVAGASSIAISTTNGLQWKEVGKTPLVTGNAVPVADIKLIDEVNGAYEVLVKMALDKSPLIKISFDTITEINAHTQPTLHLGKNTVYVGAGEQTESIAIWPELEGGRYKQFAFEENNVATPDASKGWRGSLHLKEPGEGYVVFKVDAPTDITSITYGGRLCNHLAGSHIDYLHSFDGGKTWKQDYSCTDAKPPWDLIHYERLTDIPPGTKSVLFKYALATKGTEGEASCSIYDVHMEVDHKLAAPAAAPVEVTFNWQERRNDYTTVKRSHTQLVDKLPATYTIDVGGDDQPIVDSLAINLQGARPDVKYGYSDGKDVGGEKWVGQWATYGNDLALGKPYTISVPVPSKEKVWGAGDPNGKILTDGRVGSSYTGGVNMKEGVCFTPDQNPEITVDLGTLQGCAAFRIHTLGYPFWDAMKGEDKDKVEVLISSDGNEFQSVGSFDFNLHWKDIPVNFMYPDDETFCAHNFFLPMKEPVEARYVKYKVTSNRYFNCTEVQVLDSFDFKPFDLRIALPDSASNGSAPPKPDLSPIAKQWKPEELPKTIGKAWKASEGSGE